MYETVDIPRTDIPSISIDPNLIIIGVIAAMVLGALLLLLYLPTIEEFSELFEKYKRTKLQRDYFINQLCVEMIKSGYSEEEVKRLIVDHVEEIKKEQGRTKQASNRSKFIATLGDKLRRVHNA